MITEELDGGHDQQAGDRSAWPAGGARTQLQAPLVERSACLSKNRSETA